MSALGVLEAISRELTVAACVAAVAEVQDLSADVSAKHPKRGCAVDNAVAYRLTSGS